MAQTSLLGGPRITGDQARRAQFTTALLGGYRVADVEAFRSRVVTELDLAHRALDDLATERQEFLREIERLTGQLSNRNSGPHPAAANTEQAVRILSVAQEHADRLVNAAQEEARRITGGAQRDASQLTEHTRQQADALMQRAREEGAAEKAGIVDSATAESRKQVDFLASLAKTMRGGLGGQVDELLKNLSEWDRLVHAGAEAA